MDLQKFKNKMQTEDALPLNILLDEAQSVVHKTGSAEVDAAGEYVSKNLLNSLLLSLITKGTAQDLIMRN